MIPEKVQNDFPLLRNNPELIYFDNAATSLKPDSVIEAVKSYYTEYGGNTGRGSHRITQKTSAKFDECRSEVAKFVGAEKDEMIFTKNATESINIVAVSLERMGLFKQGDEVIISKLEHHANLVPWQQLCKLTGAKLKVAELNKDFTLDMDDLREKVSRKTKMVAMAHASNTVASILPVKEIAKIAHDSGALMLVDGAQSVPDFSVNVKKINADFLAFSAHKMLGPTGIGALYGKKELLEKMPPYNFGGAMISKVSFGESKWAEPPAKFEAGTMQIAEAFGFAESVKYLKKLGIENVAEHGKRLLRHALEKMREIDGMKIYCPKNAEKQRSIVLFEIGGVDAVDLAVALDEGRKIAVRSGLHCAEPIVCSINPKGLDRASFYFYNTMGEIDAFAEEVAAVAKAFK